jgi:integrase
MNALTNPNKKLIHFPYPVVQSAIRYYDDFNNKTVTINNASKDNVWKIIVAGSNVSLQFERFHPELRQLLKCWVAFMIQTLSPATTSIRYQSLLKLTHEDIISAINSNPREVRDSWRLMLTRGYSSLSLTSIKSIYNFLCRFNLGGWSSDFLEFLSTLPLPSVDKFASVRTGEVFLGVDEEAVLVAYFDDVSQISIRSPELISNSKLNAVTILICSFQFGLRPMQIGMLQMRDVRIWKDIEGQHPSVHLTFKMIKQRTSSKVLPLTRKVKSDWAPLFIEQYARSERMGLMGTDRLFQVDNSNDVSQIIIEATTNLLPVPRCATELRHTAAQRLVDAGASQEELAEFMGHSDLDTGLVYFQTSPNQAERVNQALGISVIYQQVVKIAHDRFIGYEELSALKGEQQIGAAPHGIPIAGIGACAIGQTSCPSNPVTACYGCRKFLPLHDAEIHKKVLADFRGVVNFFSESSKGDFNSPAYLQLKRTISSVQSIIAEIEGELP